MIARLLGSWAPLANVIFQIVAFGPLEYMYAQTGEQDAVFERALRLVVDSAQDDFADLRGELSTFTRAERWDVLVTLPGFDECYLVHQARKDSRNFYQRDHFWYRCDVDFPQGRLGFASRPELEEKYRHLLALVEHSTGWSATDSDQQSEPGKIFHAPGRPPQRSIHVDALFGTSLHISVFPANTTVFPRPGTDPIQTNPDGENRIRKEVERIESAAQVSPLPAPLASDRANSAFGASRTVDNQTAFVLVMLLTGPVDKRIVLPAGTKQTFEIPAGRYKVAARLLDPDFPTLFANEEYTSGHDYRSDFVIERNLVSSRSGTDPVHANPDGESQIPNQPERGSPRQAAPTLYTKGESQIRNEVERIESAADVSPLPAALISDRADSGSTVSRTVHNQTPNVLMILLTGPVDKRIVLPPGTKQTFEIPAGRYKVAARLLATDFPPLFAIQEYISGHDYTSDFVIQ